MAKWILKSIVVLLFLIISVSGFTQELDKNVMVNKVFKALQTKNENAFVNLFPDRKTFIDYLLKIVKDPEEAASFLDDIATDSLYEAQYKEDFKNGIQSGEEKGVNWEKAIFVKAVIDSVIIDEEGLSYSSLKGKIYFSVTGVSYFLAFSSIILFEGKGWYGVDIGKIDLQSKEKNTEEDWDL